MWAIIPFFALSCMLFLPPLPSYLPHVVAVADLDKLLDAKQARGATPLSANILSPHLNVDRVTILLSQGTTKSLLTLNRTSLTDPLRIIPSTSGYITAYLGTYSQGWKSGNQGFRIDSENYLVNESTLDSVEISHGPPGIRNVYYDLPSMRIFNFIFYDNSVFYILNIQSFDNSLSPLNFKSTTFSYDSLGLPYSGSASDSLRFLQVIRYGSPDRIALLVINKVTNVGSVALFGFDYPNLSLNHTFIKVLRKGFPARFDNPDRRYTWLTEAGVVHFDQAAKTVTFYPFEDTAILPFEIDDLEPLGFSEKGTEWLGYDRVNRKLYLLRSWW